MATNNNTNNSNNSIGIMLIIGFVLIGLLPPVGILIIIIAVRLGAAKTTTRAQGKTTDYSGMNKAMVPKNINHNHNYNNHTTDYCGADKATVGPATHNHNYSNHANDFCGTDSAMIGNVARTPMATPANNKPVASNQPRTNHQQSNNQKTVRVQSSRKRASYYDGKTNEQIYNELVNRKTDYSGVDPNILKRG